MVDGKEQALIATSVNSWCRARRRRSRCWEFLRVVFSRCIVFFHSLVAVGRGADHLHGGARSQSISWRKDKTLSFSQRYDRSKFWFQCSKIIQSKKPEYLQNYQNFHIHQELFSGTNQWSTLLSSKNISWNKSNYKMVITYRYPFLIGSLHKPVGSYNKHPLTVPPLSHPPLQKFFRYQIQTSHLM